MVMATIFLLVFILFTLAKAADPEIQYGLRQREQSLTQGGTEPKGKQTGAKRRKRRKLNVRNNAAVKSFWVRARQYRVANLTRSLTLPNSIYHCRMTILQSTWKAATLMEVASPVRRAEGITEGRLDLVTARTAVVVIMEEKLGQAMARTAEEATTEGSREALVGTIAGASVSSRRTVYCVNVGSPTDLLATKTLRLPTPLSRGTMKETIMPAKAMMVVTVVVPTIAASMGTRNPPAMRTLIMPRFRAKTKILRVMKK